MASLLSPHRSAGPQSGRPRGSVRLSTTVPTEGDPDGDPTSGAPRYGWQLLAVGGALVAALAGWVIVAGLCVVGWLAADGGDLNSTLQLGTRLWLLGHGTPAELGSVRWTVTPLGVSVLIAYMISRFARGAVRFADPDEDSDGTRVLLTATALMTVSYTAVVAAVGLGTGADIPRGILGAALIALVGSWWGSAGGLGARPSSRLPGWLRPLLSAIAAGGGVLLIAGLAVLATGVVLHAGRIESLAAALGAGTVGGIALWAAQAAFAPNLILWGASYALGAGFTVGRNTVVAPAEVSLGILPSVPIFGALPENGPGSELTLLWLISGVVAGAVAALLVVRSWPAARFDEITLAGGMAAVLAALVFSGVAWFSGGDLGDTRLAGAGPRMVELVILSGSLLGLSGLICGLVLGLVRQFGRRSSESATDADAGTESAGDSAPDESTSDDDTENAPTVQISTERTADESGDRD